MLFPFRAEILWLASSRDELVVAPFNVPNGGLLKVVEVNNLTNALPREEAADDGCGNPLLPVHGGRYLTYAVLLSKMMQ